MTDFETEAVERLNGNAISGGELEALERKKAKHFSKLPAFIKMSVFSASKDKMKKSKSKSVSSSKRKYKEQNRVKNESYRKRGSCMKML